jgi:hypothetical protein
VREAAFPSTDEAVLRRLARPSFAERLGLLWRERRFRRRARPLPTLRPAGAAPVAVAPDAIVLVCVMRNAAPYLPAFLEHYRRLGIARFAVVDDRSDDGTRELLDAAPDVDRFESHLSFREAGGSMGWRDALVARYGRNRWYVSVDADEFLLYPNSETRPLAAFVADLERAGLRRSLGPMLDLYPRGALGAAVLHPGQHPLAVSPLIDGEGYRISRERIGTSIWGGPRTRLFGGENRLSKFPVIFVDEATQFSGGTHHAPLPLARNFAVPTCALLHFKFSAASLGEFRAFVAEGAHFGGSAFYRRIVESGVFGADLDLAYEGSLPVGATQELVRRGFMTDLGRGAV